MWKLLTPAQRRIVRLVARGMTNRQIALKLGIQTQTVSNAVSAILRRMGARNRIALLLLWRWRRR